MKKTVLIIDDKASELEKAIAIAKARGWDVKTCNPSVRPESYSNNAAWIEMIPEVDGVVTDLMWEHGSHGNRVEKPMGLLVVIEALSKGKPVVICTNAGEFHKGHHGEAMGFINDGYYTASDCKAFGLNERKDWNEAMEGLASRMPK